MKKANSMVSKKKTKRKKISVDSPIRMCTKLPGKRLYIVEGASAGNTLIRARDPKTEAVFPLQGKIINAESNRLDKVMNNKFTKYLLEAIGVKKLGEEFEPNFEEFVVLSDGDPDGLQISMLVMLFFYKLVPQIIKDERLKVISPPLYGVQNKNQFIPIYKIDDLKGYKQKGYRTFRFKGLGEMTEQQMSVIIRKGKIRTVRWSIDAVERIKKLFSSSEEKRKLLNISDEEIEVVLFGVET